MILDNLHNASHYLKLHPLFARAFDFASTNDFKALPLGKHEIDGERLFVILMEYDTKETSDCVMENHRRYIDIQLMVEGEELMAVTTFDGQIATTPYDEQKDAAFYEKKYDSLLKVKQDQFTIFFPHDLHMPSMKVAEVAKVRKAVFKVAVNI